MEVIYNHLFFPSDHNISFDINDFSKYMYTPDKQIIEEVQQKVIPTVKPIAKTNVIEYITPKQQDTLFWCFYISAYGYKEYNLIDRNYGVKEMEIKQRACNSLNNDTNIRKTNYKITKVLIQEIMSELNTNLNNTSFYSLLALISMAEINIFILHNEKKCYLPFVYDSTCPTFLIKKIHNNKYSVKLEKLSDEELIHIKEKYYGLESYMKPIRAISSYKVADLYDIAEKLNLTDYVLLKKQELYDVISNLLSWY